MGEGLVAAAKEVARLEKPGRYFLRPHCRQVTYAEVVGMVGGDVAFPRLAVACEYLQEGQEGGGWGWGACDFTARLAVTCECLQ